MLKLTLECHETRNNCWFGQATTVHLTRQLCSRRSELVAKRKRQAPSCRQTSESTRNLKISRRGAASPQEQPPHGQKGSSPKHRSSSGSVPGLTRPLQPAQINPGSALVSTASHLSPQVFRARVFRRTWMKTHPAEKQHVAVREHYHGDSVFGSGLERDQKNKLPPKKKAV